VALTVVVGPGRAGRSLALAQSRSGDQVLLLGRRPGSWQAWARRQGLAVKVGGPPPPARRLLLAVPDDLLAAVARELAASLPVPPFLAVHCSGLHGPEVLAPLARRGVRVAAVHPLLPFGDPRRDLEALGGGARVTVAAAPDALPAARRLVRSWGARALVLAPGVDRRRYHLALSLAANHLTALLGRAECLLEPALGAAARPAVAALARDALERYAGVGAARALTGPAVRGDLGTLLAHLKVLRGRQRLLYRALLELLLEEAAAGGRLSAGELRQLRAGLPPWPPGGGKGRG